MSVAEVKAVVEKAPRVKPEPCAEEKPMGRPLDLRALAGRKAPPREWLIDQWMPRNGPILLAGAGGVGKSLLMQQVATGQALQRSFIGEAPHAARVMVWGCEDDADELWRRQEAISEYFGAALDGPAERLVLVSRFGCENTLMAPLLRTGQLAKTNIFEGLREQVNDLGIDALWLDNVAHLYAGNPDDRNQVTTFINALMGLVSGRPLAVAIVTHTARQQGSEFAGSAAWENACRARWYFGTKLPDQKDAGEDEGSDPHMRFLARRKSNYSAQDHLRMTMRGGVLVPDQLPDRVGGLVAHMDERKAEEVLVAGFKSLRAMGLVPSHAKNSPDYLPREVAAKGLGCGYSGADLGRALNRLMGKGVFAVGVAGQYANRNPKQGLVLQSEGEA